MSVFAVLILAAGLAVDSCLVALAQGVAARGQRLVAGLRTGIVFGAFQGSFAALGWLVGAPIARLFGEIDHWIAFSVLAGLGIATIRGRAAESSSVQERRGDGSASATSLVVAAVATSVDAAAVGFSLRLAEEPITLLALATALITAAGATLAYAGGRHIGRHWQRAARWIAGLALIAIGSRILYEHLA